MSVGTTSVSVATDRTRLSRVIVVCEHQIYALEYSSEFSRKSPATLNKVYFTGEDIPSFQQGSMTPFTQAEPADPNDSMAGLTYFLAESQLYMAYLKQDAYLVPRQLPIDGNPTKILYSDYLKKLIVLHVRTTITQPRQTNEQHVGVAQRALKPWISFLDPDAEPAEHDPDDIDDRGTRELERIAGEKVLGMMEWFPLEEDDKVYPLLVINTLVKENKQAASGRLLLFTMRQGANSDVTLECRKRFEPGSPVYAVASYGRSSLVYCCGKDLVLHKLAMHPTKRWNEPIRYTMGSPAAHISVHGDEVYVTTTKDSLSVFKIENNKFVYQFSDQVARNGLHHLEVPHQSLTLISDMGCSVTGLWKPPKPRIDNLMCTVFQAVLPGSISRLRRLARARWYRKTPTASVSQFSDVTPSFLRSGLTRSSLQRDHTNEGYPNEEVEAIIGGSADGALYQFDILDEPSWRLLRYIQNMAIQDSIICPFSTKTRHLNIEPATSDRSMHVNGDILQRLLDRGGENLLRDMLIRGEDNQLQDMMDLDSTDEDDERRPTGSKTVSPRRERLDELVAEVEELADAERDVAAVVQWLRFKLLRAL